MLLKFMNCFRDPGYYNCRWDGGPFEQKESCSLTCHTATCILLRCRKGSRDPTHLPRQHGAALWSGIHTYFRVR